ncbi:hypothetical protein WR25_26876 [Diploscapter pachys]|uniref:Uncharacterized protein n=1 Tax=Diploscapter pachys TaxID=2018661 RepID=A0A2A2K781_9BILA|nr:hypothetical protein WR25_26876 [Diploscapter pachys]
MIAQYLLIFLIPVALAQFGGRFGGNTNLGGNDAEVDGIRELTEINMEINMEINTGVNTEDAEVDGIRGMEINTVGDNTEDEDMVVTKVSEDNTEAEALAQMWALE